MTLARSLLRLCSFLLVPALVVTGLAGPASADGDTIEGSEKIRSRVQYYGTTETYEDAQGNHYEYWRLPVAAGDRVRIDWEIEDDSYNMLRVFPVGTDDFSVGSSDYDEYYAESNNRQRTEFTSGRAGDHVLMFFSRYYRNGGTYNFNATMLHASTLRPGRIAKGRRTGTTAVKAVDSAKKAIKSGMTITMQGKVGKQKWSKVGRASLKKGTASVKWALPKSWRGKKVVLRFLGSGRNYYRVKTGTYTTRF
ncbi:hypothetical protein [Nocardioides bruguierae]|uniref:Uncharacterized protein n=1 Tax=Nocardioides bruguierae TaxID=2945102 RepID=A0A9X2IFZ3_9ACTN|nr:hypothetical protein [Nocardioides bruguierae]MCM0621817.1 hypothetical protein [Nocardioides bruguierae]